MGCSHNLISRLRLHHFAISLLILLISSSSHLRIFHAEGRILVQGANNHKTVKEDQKAILRSQIGSRPPQCEKRCSSCAHCEAIQVPTNSTTISGIAYNRGDDPPNYNHNLISRLRLHHFAISLLILLISSSSHLGIFHAEGRILVQGANNHKTVKEDQKAILMSQIGSRPPQCEKRCSSCAHCEAIQVPTNSTTISGIAYNRGDDPPNYKSMSWKCKCGNQIFNP
ncbi:unnamed protein product [Fraxinus pennsylvanica]|uniref:Epidermal patterning factor-like protein n=1 Tax=Fraxinus pennsylvanica TaxID=56036 RepID=A0AAD2DTM7_9LAMI|nr:unnamed protein product [Fraxinus pennsylvanica]